MIFLSPTFRQANRVQSQAGFILLPVVIAIVIVASVAFMLNNQSVISSHSLGGEIQGQQARYVAEAGLNHSIQQIQAAECKSYKNLNELFLAHGYKTKVTPTEGSPVSITSEGLLAATPSRPLGASKTLTRDNIRVFQLPIIEILQPDAAEGKDGWVDASRPNDSFGVTGEMTISGGASPEHFLIEFDTSLIPNAATILSATLEMHLNYMSSADPDAEFSIYRMLQVWAEGTGDYWNPGDGANWATSDGSASWLWVSNHDTSNVIATRQVNPGFSGWHDWDITSLVQQWASGLEPNYGLLITGNANVGNANFHSSDWFMQSERPKLTITYACECGLTCGGTTPPVVPPGYYDEFNSLTCVAATDYIGSDGILDWSGFQWQEQDNGNSCTGSVWLLEHQGSNRLAMTSSGGWIERKVDLSGFTGATLNLDYLQIGALDSSHYSSIKFSGDNGSSWTELGRIDTPGDGTTYLLTSYVIPPALINANSMLRFENTLLLSGRAVYLDNINIVEGGSIIGPLAHWKLDETSGTIAVDSVGGHDGMLTNGPTWTTGQLGGALQFDGTNDYINVPHDDTLSLTTFSISAWIRPDTVSGFHAIVYKGASTSEANYHLYTDADEISLGLTSGGWEYFITTTNANLVAGQWYHLITTFDGASGEGKHYINGSLNHTGTIGPSPVMNTGPITIGTDPFNEFWYGLLDDVRIYDSVLPAAEIADLYSAGGGGGGGGPPPTSGEVIFEEYTQASLTSDETSINITKPGGTAGGDLLIAVVVTDGEQKKKMSASGGWTLVNHGKESKQVSMDVWWKLADASEPAQYTFGWEKSQEAYGWIMRFTGHDPVSPINVSSSAGGSSNSPTSPAVTTTVANTLILRIGGFDDDDITAGVPGLASHTAITMSDSGDGASTTSGGAGYMTQAVAGDSGTADFSLTATEEYRVVTIGIAPAP